MGWAFWCRIKTARLHSLNRNIANRFDAVDVTLNQARASPELEHTLERKGGHSGRARVSCNWFTATNWLADIVRQNWCRSSVVETLIETYLALLSFQASGQTFLKSSASKYFSPLDSVKERTSRLSTILTTWQVLIYSLQKKNLIKTTKGMGPTLFYPVAFFLYLLSFQKIGTLFCWYFYLFIGLGDGWRNRKNAKLQGRGFSCRSSTQQFTMWKELDLSNVAATRNVSSNDTGTVAFQLWITPDPMKATTAPWELRPRPIWGVERGRARGWFSRKGFSQTPEKLPVWPSL